MANRKNSGKGGRKPRPTTLKIASGMRADRIPVGEPKAPGGPVEAPAWLDSHGLEGWRRIVAAVERLGLLSPVDADALAVYSGAYSRWRRAWESIEADGLVIEGSHGGKVPNPAVGIAERAERIMISTLGLFGLNPSDRSRLKASEQTADPLDEFLKENA